MTRSWFLRRTTRSSDLPCPIEMCPRRSTH